ncbi:MAG TPA: HAMP domain-containing sensor histidine kinase [Baekduia sp.]|nr:HAMP domain-containing sensor histidine kinase [Baekduia sp.]
MSLRGRLLLAIAYPLAVATLALALPLALNLRDRVRSEVREQAATQASLLGATWAKDLEGHRRAALQRLAREAAPRVRGRVVVVDEAGRLLADSDDSAPAGTSFRGRPEIARALTGRRVQVERDSRTLGATLLATAVPVLEDGRTVGAVRITQRTTAVSSAVRRAVTAIAVVAGIVLLAGLVLAVALAGQLARPMRRMAVAADAVAAGDLGTRVPVEGPPEHRRLAAAFNTMTERVAATLALQRDFVADASHALRTPLAGVRLRLEELGHTSTDPAAREDVDAALTEVDRLSRIVDELLVLGSAESLEPEPVDLAHVARDAVTRFAGPAHAAGIALRADGAAPDAAPVLLPLPDLERALDALVENALAYGDHEVTVRAADGRIEVLDDGPGLAAGEEEAVFERFHRGSAGARRRGSGLGLAIARGLARRWGGDVRLERRPEGGTRAVLEAGR